MRTSFAAVSLLGLMNACSSSSNTVYVVGNAGNTAKSVAGNAGKIVGNTNGQAGSVLTLGGAPTAGGSGGTTPSASGASTGTVAVASGGSGFGGAAASSGVGPEMGGTAVQMGGASALSAGAPAQTGGTLAGGNSAVSGASNTGGTTIGAMTAAGGSIATGGTIATTGTGGVAGGNLVGGAATTGGLAATGGSSSTAVDLPSLIDLTNTHFLDYGKLRIAVTQRVQAASLQIQLTPSRPTQLVVTAVAEVDTATLDVTLGYYHLPIDYDVSIKGQLTDGTRFTTSAVVPGLNNGSRVAFVTKQYGSGNLKSWPNAPTGAATGRDAGDGICQAEATAAGFKGTFVALLSSNTAAQGRYDAGCRAFGLLGTLPHCGQSSAPVDHAPWLSAVGLPIINGATDLVDNQWLTTIPFHADATRAESGAQPYRSLSWGGIAPGTGASGYDCTGWTSDSSGDTGTCIGYPGEYLPEYDTANSDCGSGLKLVCLQVTGTFFGPNTLHQIVGKRAFASNTKTTGAIALAGKVGIEAADMMCQGDAVDAGLPNPGTFRAYLSTTSNDALCHVLGASGKVSSLCSLASLPTAAWRRLDGYPFATPAQLTAASTQYLTTPILYGADSTRIVTTRERIWTGTSVDGSVNSSCSDWGVTTGTGYAGVATSINSAWTLFTIPSCTASQRIYCFEQ